MEVHFKLEQDDLIAVERYKYLHLQNPSNGWSSREMMAVGAAIMSALLLVAYGFLNGFLLPVLLALALFFWLSRLLVWPSSLQRNARRNAEQGAAIKTIPPDAPIFEEFSLRIDPNGLLHRRRFKSSSIRWSAIEKIDLTNELLVFLEYSGPTALVAVAVPRNSFNDDESLNQFVETARHYRDAAIAQN